MVNNSVEMEILEYFYPNGGWCGYNQFFIPSIPSRIGEVFVSHINKAIRYSSVFSCQEAIKILSKEHNKKFFDIEQRVYKDVVCYPTGEATKAIDVLIKFIYYLKNENIHS